MSFGTRLYTALYGQLVGTDSFGNRYYCERKPQKITAGGGMFSRPRRWVLYNGMPEASKVPPEWHGWLHHSVDAPPDAQLQTKRPWQKPHLPNLTGTKLAYRPAGSVLASGHHAKSAGDYEPWTPN